MNPHVYAGGVDLALAKGSTAYTTTSISDTDIVTVLDATPVNRATADANGDTISTTYVKNSALATVATSGDYTDLLSQPFIPVATSDIVNDSGFLTAADLGAVAFTNDYGDLDNLPTIPTAASDIGAQEELVSGTNIKTINNQSLLGSGNISISGGGGTSDYDQLSNRPQIAGVTLTGNMSLSDLGIQEEIAPADTS